MLNLHKLQVFAVVVECGSFSAAAQQLFITQPAVSQHILDLETTLGTRLFDRQHRGVRLTSAGQTLYQYTERILGLVLEAEASVIDIERIVSGQIHIGATPGINAYILPAWIQIFRRQHINLNVRLVTGVTTEIISQVRRLRLDLGFVEGELDGIAPDGFAAVALRSIDMLVVVGREHPWAQQEAVAVEQLGLEPFIMREPNSRTRVLIDRFLAQHRLEPPVVAEFDSPESIKQAVISQLGVSILPAYAIKSEVASRQLRALPLVGATLRRHIKLITPTRVPLSPMGRAFLQGIADRYPQVKPLAEE